MFVIDKNKKIILTKGDTASIKLDVVSLDGKEREVASDVIKMTIKKTPSSQASITKIAENKTIIIEPADTSNLPAGLYIYDVQLTTIDGNVYTIVPTSYFELRNEVSA